MRPPVRATREHGLLLALAPRAPSRPLNPPAGAGYSVARLAKVTVSETPSRARARIEGRFPRRRSGCEIEAQANHPVSGQYTTSEINVGVSPQENYSPGSPQLLAADPVQSTGTTFIFPSIATVLKPFAPSAILANSRKLWIHLSPLGSRPFNNHCR